MADKKIKLDLEIATKQAQASIKDAAKEAKKLGTTLDDTRSAGKKLADAMDTVASVVDKELTQAVKAADKLEQAIGVDGVEAFKKNGKSVDDLVAELKNAGLTYQDIEDDSDALAKSLQRLNDVGSKIDQHITKNMQGVARETDNSRSVMANFAGNAVQELPGVGSAFGPLNMAIGQFTEYASEGNISLLGMASTAGPIAGVAVAMELLSKHMASVAKRENAQKDRVNTWAKALAQAGDKASNLADEIENIGKVDFRQDGLFGGVVDATDDLQRAGLTVHDYTRLISGSKEDIRAWYEAQKAAGNNSSELAGILLVLDQGMTDYQKATKAAAITQSFFADETHGATQKVHLLSDALDRQGKEWDRLNDKLNNQDIYTNAIDTLRDTEAAVNDKKRAVHDYLQEVLKLPARTATKIDVLIDQGKFDEAEAKLNMLTRARNATVWSQLMTTNNDTHAAGRNAPVKAFASGTNNAPEGPALVGENGPEIVNLNAGDTVTTAGDTKRLLGSTYIDNRRTYVYTPPFSPTSTYESNYRYLKRNGLL